MSEVLKQTEGGKAKYGGISDKKALAENLKQNCIPEGFDEMEFGDYEKFLKERRKLMAKKIRVYYESL